MDIVVVMKSGKEYEFRVMDANIKKISNALNKYKFVHFGPIAFNTAEIELVKVIGTGGG